MGFCGAVRLGLFAAFIAVWLGEQVQGSLAQTRPSVSPSQPAKVSPRKQSAPTKEVGTSENRYAAGFVTGAPYSTEFAMAQEIATELASGQETGPRGEMAWVIPMVGNGGTRN